MKKFLLIALAALLVLTSMVVLAEDAPKTKIFEKIDGEQTYHFYYEGDKPAKDIGRTCTEGGILTYLCQELNCDHEIVAASNAPLGHAFKEGTTEVVTPATCQAPGVQKGYCTRCEAEATAEIPQKSHDFKIDQVAGADGKMVDVVVAPTCKEDGYSPATCVNVVDGKPCGATTKLNITAKLNHKNMTGDVQIEGETPTCDKGGSCVLFTYCPDCNEKFYIHEQSKYYEKLEPLHQDQIDEWLFVDEEEEETPYEVALEVLALAGKDGKSEIKLSNKVALSWFKVSVDNFNVFVVPETYIVYKPATCTTPGSLKLVCSNEKCTAHGELIIPAHGHEYDFYWGEDGNGKPTCTDNGTCFIFCKNAAQNKWGCDFVEEQAEIKAPGSHNWNEDEDSWKYSQDKTDMDDVVKGNFAEIAECHDYTAHVPCQGYVTELTFGKAGTFKFTITCTKTDDRKVDGNGEHKETPELTAKQEENCYQGGYYHTYCSECGNYFGYEEEATGMHIKEYEIVTKPTCTTDGEWKITCKTPGCIWTVNEPIPMTGHDWMTKQDKTKLGDLEKKLTDEGWYITKAMDCRTNTAGVIKRECEYCGAIETDTIEVAHTYDEQTFNPDAPNSAYKAPTCTEPGSISFQCAVCHEDVINQPIDALGHEWERAGWKTKYTKKAGNGKYYQTKTAATCMDVDVYTRTCSYCTMKDKNNKVVPYTETYKEGSLKPHTLFNAEGNIKNFVIKTLPTCESVGLAYYNCDLCGKLDSYELPALPHNYTVEYNKTTRVYEKVCVAVSFKNGAYDKGGMTWAKWDAHMANYLKSAISNADVRAKVVNALKDRLDDTNTTYVPGIGCQGIVEITLNPAKYDITKKNDIVTIKLQDKCVALVEPIVRVTWSYTLSDGTLFSYTRYVEAKTIEGKDATFKLGYAETPTGAVLDKTTVIVVDKEGLTAAEAIKQGYGWDKF